MQDLMRLTRNETERRMLKKMEERGFPGSVRATVFTAMQYDPEEASNLEATLDEGATAREMVKAVQPILQRLVAE